MGRVKSAKDLPEGVLEFESTPEGDIVYGKELETARKQQTASKAKEELAKTDTLGSKAKAVGEDVAKTVFGVKVPGYSNRPFNAATKEHNEKVKKLKETVDMKKGGMVSSASKRADGCAVRGKTKGRMV